MTSADDDGVNSFIHAHGHSAIIDRDLIHLVIDIIVLVIIPYLFMCMIIINLLYLYFCNF